MTPRQTTEEILRQYGGDDFIDSLRSDAQMGVELREMIETKGWKDWFYPMIDETMKKLSSIEGVTTLKELEGRKQALSALKNLFAAFEAIVDKGESAVIKLEQVDQQEQV